MTLYTWELNMLGLRRFILVQAYSVEEARLLAMVHNMAENSQYLSGSPSESLFAMLMQPPDFEQEFIEPDLPAMPE